MTQLTFQIAGTFAKKRLDEFLFENLTGLSKMYLRELIKSGKCEVNGLLENSGYRLRGNDFVELDADLTRATAMRPAKIDLDILFEDADLLVVNKPAGMLVHPTHRDKDGTLLNALSFHLNSGGRGSPGSGHIRPGLVHRLDKQTSGLIAIAKTIRSHRVLSERFRRRLVSKRYTALVSGAVADESGIIEHPIGRIADEKRWTVQHDGKSAETHFFVKERRTDSTLLELTPITGRTNQLRIHCESIGHPIVGDHSRGGSEFHRLCLHASSLSFCHPSTGHQLKFESADPGF